MRQPSRPILGFAVLTVALALTATAQQSSVTAGSFPAATTANIRATTGDTSTSEFQIFNSANTALLRVYATGDVVVGGGTSGLYGPSDRFYVFENADTNTLLTVDNPHTGVSAIAGLRAQSDAASVNFQAHGSGRTLSRFGVTLGGWAEFLQWRGNGFAIGTLGAVPLILGTGNQARIYVAGDGRVGIGTVAPGSGKALHVVGHAQFDGTVSGTFIKAHYQDVAEWVPSKNDLAPGTVVVLDGGNSVRASLRPYDTSVAGVVSAQPGILLGEEGAEKEQVATTGRVRVKVEASRGPIAVGDLLVTSDKPGYAMRSTPIDVGGAQIHRPGTILGKALEPLAGGQGEILVLLSLQ